jgi:hypothetical protein
MVDAGQAAAWYQDRCCGPPASADRHHHAAAKCELVAMQRPVYWVPPSILRPPEVLTELEVVEAEGELKLCNAMLLR